MEESNILWTRNIFTRLSANIETIVKGQKKCIRYILAGFASGGHIL